MKKRKKNWILFGGIAILLIAAVLVVNSARTDQSTSTSQRSNASANPAPPQTHSHSATQAAAQRVPAFLQAPNRASLGPSLDPERFTGITRDAYRAARQIPMTLAQLPCYCHCDEEFGHKSLYSCYQDEHAASCAVCVNEALLALKLEQEQKLTPAEIRERIMQQYSNQ